jgi:hypothetical protein
MLSFVILEGNANGWFKIRPVSGQFIIMKPPQKVEVLEMSLKVQVRKDLSIHRVSSPL